MREGLHHTVGHHTGRITLGTQAVSNTKPYTQQARIKTRRDKPFSFDHMIMLANTALIQIEPLYTIHPAKNILKPLIALQARPFGSVSYSSAIGEAVFDGLFERVERILFSVSECEGACQLK